MIVVASFPSGVSGLVKATTSMPSFTIHSTASTISLVSPEALDQKDHLEVTDRLQTGDKEAAVSWIMVTPAEAKITGKNRMELTKDGQRMLLTVDADTEVEMKTWSNVPPH